MAKEYRHVVIDKFGAGVENLRDSINQNGIQTAQSRGIALAQGSQHLEHHLHVFLWDDSRDGIKHWYALKDTPSSFTIRVRWNDLTETGYIFSGNLKGDGGQNGPPSGKSPNGAWAYKGNIPRNFCFIDGLDTEQKQGYSQWLDGNGWQ